MGFFVSHIFIYMRLTPILIKEGRKEDLRKKYSNKFKEYPETLDFILGISDLADTNFKYADFVLRELHPNTSDEEIEDAIELVKDFDRFKQSLVKKDINQYQYPELQNAIQSHITSSKSQLNKFDASGAEKIFEDKNILIIKPLTHRASCKYGAGTKWCTSMDTQSSYFETHTTGNQGLYYIILKNFDQSNKFYKIAIHIKPNAETWYDATDTPMSSREKEVFNLGAPKVIGMVRKNYEESVLKSKYDLFNKLFSAGSYTVSGALNTKQTVVIEYSNPNIDFNDDMENHALMEMNISIDGEYVDQYAVMIVLNYDINNPSLLVLSIGFSWDDSNTTLDFDLHIEKLDFDLEYSIPKLQTDNEIKKISEDITYQITKRVVSKMKQSPEFMSLVHGGESTWIPNRSSYGFTFKKNAGMVKKLVDYLDSGKIGTKLDFLIDIGILEKKDVNGKPYFSRVGQNDWHIASRWRGQHSGFFNSAKSVGILDYDKKGNQFYLKKGPNFEKFKSGKLKAL